MHEPVRPASLSRRATLGAAGWIAPIVLTAVRAPNAAASPTAAMQLTVDAPGPSLPIMPGTTFAVFISVRNSGTAGIDPGLTVRFSAPADLFGAATLIDSPGWSAQSDGDLITLRHSLSIPPGTSSAVAELSFTRPIEAARWSSPGESFTTVVIAEEMAADRVIATAEQTLTIWPAQRTTRIRFDGSGLLDDGPLPPHSQPRWELTLTNLGAFQLPAGFTIDLSIAAPAWTTWFLPPDDGTTNGSTSTWSIVVPTDAPMIYRISHTAVLDVGETVRLLLTFERSDASPAEQTEIPVGFEWVENFAVNQGLVDPTLGVVDNDSETGRTAWDFRITSGD